MNFNKKIITAILIISLIASLSLAIFLFFYNPIKVLKVNFLDVGQGDSVLIQTPYDQNILIDGGDGAQILQQLPKFMPFYDRKIDLIILTHPHDDHAGGLNYVLKRYQVARILYTGVVHNSPTYLNLLDIIKRKQIPMTIIDRPQQVRLGEDLYFDILYPFVSLLNQEVDNLNNSSIVTKLIYKNNSFLFTGDAEIEVEEALTPSPRLYQAGQDPSPRTGEGSYINLQSDVFLAGHHGSDTSNSEEFLKMINPEITIIQVGKNNDFGHPSLRTLKRLERLGSDYYRNDLNGWIQVISNGEDLEIITEK